MTNQFNGPSGEDNSNMSRWIALIGQANQALSKLNKLSDDQTKSAKAFAREYRNAYNVAITGVADYAKELGRLQKEQEKINDQLKVNEKLRANLKGDDVAKYSDALNKANDELTEQLGKLQQQKTLFKGMADQAGYSYEGIKNMSAAMDMFDAKTTTAGKSLKVLNESLATAGRHLAVNIGLATSFDQMVGKAFDGFSKIKEANRDLLQLQYTLSRAGSVNLSGLTKPGDVIGQTLKAQRQEAMEMVKAYGITYQEANKTIGDIGTIKPNIGFDAKDFEQLTVGAAKVSQEFKMLYGISGDTTKAIARQDIQGYDRKWDSLERTLNRSEQAFRRLKLTGSEFGSALGGIIEQTGSYNVDLQNVMQTMENVGALGDKVAMNSRQQMVMIQELGRGISGMDSSELVRTLAFMEQSGGTHRLGINQGNMFGQVGRMVELQNEGRGGEIMVERLRGQLQTAGINNLNLANREQRLEASGAIRTIGAEIGMSPAFAETFSSILAQSTKGTASEITDVLSQVNNIDPNNQEERKILINEIAQKFGIDQTKVAKELSDVRMAEMLGGDGGIMGLINESVKNIESHTAIISGVMVAASLFKSAGVVDGVLNKAMSKALDPMLNKLPLIGGIRANGLEAAGAGAGFAGTVLPQSAKEGVPGRGRKIAKGAGIAGLAAAAGLTGYNFLREKPEEGEIDTFGTYFNSIAQNAIGGASIGSLAGATGGTVVVPGIGTVGLGAIGAIVGGLGGAGKGFFDARKDLEQQRKEKYYNPIKGRAKGGQVDSNETFLVGEQGPEIFVPRTVGNILPHNFLSNLTGQSSMTEDFESFSTKIIAGISNSLLQSNGFFMQFLTDLLKSDISGILKGVTGIFEFFKGVKNWFNELSKTITGYSEKVQEFINNLPFMKEKEDPNTQQQGWNFGQMWKNLFPSSGGIENPFNQNIPELKGGGENREKYEPIAEQIARKYNINEQIFKNLITQESGWRPTIRSNAGAIGMTQLMPSTAKSLGVRNPLDPVENMEGGAKYLSQLLKQHGSYEMALAAYNGGPGAVDYFNKRGGIFHNPNAPSHSWANQTGGYVKKILGDQKPTVAQQSQRPKAVVQSQQKIDDDELNNSLSSLERSINTNLPKTASRLSSPKESSLMTDRLIAINARAEKAKPANISADKDYSLVQNITINVESGGKGNSELASEIASKIKSAKKEMYVAMKNDLGRRPNVG